MIHSGVTTTQADIAGTAYKQAGFRKNIWSTTIKLISLALLIGQGMQNVTLKKRIKQRFVVEEGEEDTRPERMRDALCVGKQGRWANLREKKGRERFIDADNDTWGENREKIQTELITEDKEEEEVLQYNWV